MGSGASREDVIASKWWETKAQKMLITTTIDKIEVICSLLPLEDGKTVVELLKARPDLETLFALHCRDQDLSNEQRANPSSLTVDFKAHELWRKFRMPLGYGESPWNWNWQPRLVGIASEIADEFQSAVSRAVFRIPFLEFVKWAVGYNALFVRSLFSAVVDVRDNLRKAILHVPWTKDLYIEVEKNLKSRHLKLAHWIVASSLSSEPYPLEFALASIWAPAQKLFATRNLDLILEKLSVLDGQFRKINQRHKGDESLIDHYFYTYQALGSVTPRILAVDPDILKDMDEMLSFLASFASVSENRVHVAVGRTLSFLKFRHRGAIRRPF